jgi:hypothetical protein
MTNEAAPAAMDKGSIALSFVELSKYPMRSLNLSSPKILKGMQFRSVVELDASDKVQVKSTRVRSSIQPHSGILLEQLIVQGGLSCESRVCVVRDFWISVIS